MTFFTPPRDFWCLTSDCVLCLWQIQSQLNKALDDMSSSLCTLKEGMSYTKQLPSKGLLQSQVLDKIREYQTLSKHDSSSFATWIFICTGDLKSVSNLMFYWCCVFADEVRWEKGCVSGAVYWGDETLTKLLVQVCIIVYISGLWHLKHKESNVNTLCFFLLQYAGLSHFILWETASFHFSQELSVAPFFHKCSCFVRYMEILRGATHFTQTSSLV